MASKYINHLTVVLVLLSLAACKPPQENIDSNTDDILSELQNATNLPAAAAMDDLPSASPRHLQLAEQLLLEAPASASVVSEGTRQLITAAIASGDTALAARLVEKLRREPFPYWEESARLAHALAEAGQQEAATELLERVLAGRTYFGGVFRERIELQVMGALAALGRNSEAEEILQTFTDDSRTELARAMLAIGRLRREGTGNFKVDSSLMPATFSPQYLPVAEQLVEIVDIMLESGNREAAIGFAASLQDYVGKVSANASRFYLKLADTYWKHGLKDELTDALVAGYPHYNNLSGGIPEFYQMVAAMARFASDAGRRDTAEQLLAAAPEAMEFLPATEQPPAYARLGVGCVSLGLTQQADDYFAKAVTAAEALKNPAAIPVARMAVLLILADAGIDPPESLAATAPIN